MLNLKPSLSSSKKKMKTPNTKKKKLSQPNPNQSLPDDLLLSIIARVPRLYYPTLSRVSKSFRSLLASPELYKARSVLLGHTETFLYVCFHSYPGPNTHWFTLCQKPDQTLTNDTGKKKSSGYVLARVPIPGSPLIRFPSLVAVGSNIYNIGGSIDGEPSSSMSILDCRSHMWREAPSLRVELMSLSATVLDRKIYVAGTERYKDGNGNSDSLKNSFVVFDTNTQVWDPEPIPYNETIGKYLMSTRSTCIDGKFHVMNYRDAFAYNSKESRWDNVGRGMGAFWYLCFYCEIENVLYACCCGELRWYDTKVRMWKQLKGLKGLPKLPPGAAVRLADYGGNLAILWDEYCPRGPSRFRDEKKIWCAEIALKRRKNSEIWGKVEWFGHVLTVPMTYFFVKVLATTPL